MNLYNKLKKESINHLHNDIVDWNMNEFDEESNESHQSETDGGSESNLLEFYKKQKICKNKKKFLCFKIFFYCKPFRSGLVHFWTRRYESFMNCLPGSMYWLMVSMSILV